MKKTSLSIYIISTVLLFTACDEKPVDKAEQPLRPVRTIVASATNGISGRDFPGVVVAENKADLSFRVAGKLKELLIKEGDRVTKGQILAQLDKTDFVITVEDKQASYDEAKANFERSEKLIEPGHISKREFDQIKAVYSTASSHLKAAQQNLFYTELKAPFNGSITKIYVDNFEEVQAKAVVATLQNLGSMEIEIDVPESLMIQIKREHQPQNIVASFNDIKGKQFPLTVREVSTQADETTHAYKVKLSLPNIENYTILPGMTATVIANKVKPTDEESTSNRIIVPSHAVLEDNKGRFVYIAEPDSISGTGIIHRRNVTTAKLTNHGLEVTSGINPEDLVVTAGMSKMQEGMRVRLMAKQNQ